MFSLKGKNITETKQAALADLLKHWGSRYSVIAGSCTSKALVLNEGAILMFVTYSLGNISKNDKNATKPIPTFPELLKHSCSRYKMIF